ncbi:hypothetical protein [Microcoleus sp. N9_A4]|uniref:hypothetical protein n=1 Tax=Microcoleus sp. N9_A4 TaxID=3055383 RepID=UPI002FD0E065
MDGWMDGCSAADVTDVRKREEEIFTFPLLPIPSSPLSLVDILLPGCDQTSAVPDRLSASQSMLYSSKIQ